MVSHCWLLWTVSAGCYGQSMLVAIVSLCWFLWSVSADCYGQSLLVVMVSLCWLLWPVSASCYGQSLLVVMVSLCWLLWSVSVGCYGQCLLETWLLWSVAVEGQAGYFLACCIGCLAAWLPSRLLFFLGRGGRSSVSMDHRALPHIISQDHRVSVTVKSLLTTQHRNRV